MINLAVDLATFGLGMALSAWTWLLLDMAWQLWVWTLLLLIRSVHFFFSWTCLLVGLTRATLGMGIATLVAGRAIFSSEVPTLGLNIRTWQLLAWALLFWPYMAPFGSDMTFGGPGHTYFD